MSNKLKYLSFAAVTLFLCIFLAIQQQNNDTATVQQMANFTLEDTTGIDKFTFGKAVIRRKNATEWTINDKYAVDDEMLFSLFSVMKSLEIKRPVPAGQRNSVIDLFLRNGTEVTILAGAKVYKKFFVAGDSSESYAMLDKGEPYEIYIPGGFYMPIRQLFEINEEEWRNRTILKTSSATLKSLSVEYASTPDKNLYVEFKSVKSSTGLDSGYYSLRGEKAVNLPRLYKFLGQYSSVKCEAYINDPALRDSLKTAKPFSKITLTDLDDANSDVMLVFPSKTGTLALLEKKQELVLMNPQYLGQLLGIKQAFLPTKQSK